VIDLRKPMRYAFIRSRLEKKVHPSGITE